MVWDEDVHEHLHQQERVLEDQPNKKLIRSRPVAATTIFMNRSCVCGEVVTNIFGFLDLIPQHSKTASSH